MPKIQVNHQTKIYIIHTSHFNETFGKITSHGSADFPANA